MPLSSSAEREFIHHRKIDCKGYQRKDGFWDIEGHLVDTKNYAFENHDRGKIKAGQPIHDMWLRITLDDEMVIHEVEAVIDASPYSVCPAITKNFKKLRGISIKSGWRRSIQNKVGGIFGCTHLVELLNPIATTAFQTLYKIKSDSLMKEENDKKPALLETCHAFSLNSPVVKQLWPSFYKKQD